ncbi:hypothetical protein BaRGS_00006073 [Batillaria attramentaria]|uniref:Uncharacterized protein n=1 Tax=Batillaria attramentaria TaxID=370345 RepID=A0ABD0LTW5_9CAEN
MSRVKITATKSQRRCFTHLVLACPNSANSALPLQNHNNCATKLSKKGKLNCQKKQSLSQKWGEKGVTNAKQPPSTVSRLSTLKII